MKKFAGLLLALGLTAILLCGCGEKEEASSSSSPSSAVSSSAPVSPAPVQMAKAVKIKADAGLNIRSKPSMDGEILGLAENGSMLPLLVEKAADGWYQVEYQGKSAYVSAEYAEMQEVTLETYNGLKNGSASPSQGDTSSSSPESSSQGSASPAPSSGDDPGRPGASSSQAVSSTPTQAAGNGEDGE